MLLSNTLSAAVPGTPGKLVEVTLWTMESADALKNRLDKLSSGVGDGIGDALRSVTIGTQALQGSMDNLARHVPLNADVSAQLARESMCNMRNAAVAGAPGASTIGLGLISLWFQQDSLRRSYESLLDTVGDKHPEAAAAVMSASLGVMGASVEVVGGAIPVGLFLDYSSCLDIRLMYRVTNGRCRYTDQTKCWEKPSRAAVAVERMARYRLPQLGKILDIAPKQQPL
ncbi:MULTISPECIES: hypothetical protein [unclassified Pseudomonas]|uniref:hypothetical protein n=1 Tax=unclassified Pseudomonas TaxID=196821 RepID=UPI0021C6E74B|nr:MULTISPECIES: hypothetical protein [unclassified Pseudomonas]MCU1730975.1 hypothetical protein [Pseudomonas sp. 20P_3.2_Bac4]MCU1742698.1 hypothetical protein [Pseudomonas sp. 20P_3.2_Bac5]